MNAFKFYLLSLSSFVLAEQASLIMIFAHGLADTHAQAYLWQKSAETDRPYLFNGQIITYDFPDATHRFWRVNFPWTSLGQENEISALKEIVEKTQLEHPESNIILAGLSRGAVTIINYLALYKPKGIAAVVLESPFPSMRHVAQHVIASSWLQHIPFIYDVCPHLISCFFWKYSNNGAHPIDLITSIDCNIPMLLISQENDYLVPSRLTQLLVDKLLVSGHKRIHHLKLTRGNHGKYIQGEEGLKMQRVSQAFFYYYGLPCDLKSAREGMIEFAKTISKCL